MAFYEKYVKPQVKAAWADVEAKDPASAKLMLADLPQKYRLEGTGFSKVTVALNNPTRQAESRGDAARRD